MNNFDEEIRFNYVRSVACAAIADELRDYPWEQLPPAQTQSILASLPRPKRKVATPVISFPGRVQRG
jgi:hypothetical protein